MRFVLDKVTRSVDFFHNINPYDLIEKYGSPLYVYNERILRERCRELKDLTAYKNFTINYSAKANSNLSLLRIIREEGLDVDAMSPGEIYLEQAAGFKSDQIFYIGNNVSLDEMKYAVSKKILVSVDSLSQLEMFGRHFPGERVAVRINTGQGAGHHEKVVTAGKETKFAINPEDLAMVKELVAKYSLKLVGLNQHIGSLFMDSVAYISSAQALFQIAKRFDGLEFVDIGGGFGIPYNKLSDQPRLDLAELGQKLSEIIHEFIQEYGREIKIKIEPGRYIPAESSLILGTVHAIKYNHGTKYVGTDVGFNVLIRPSMYDSHHDIEVYRSSDMPSLKTEHVTVVGNICETGDIIAKSRELPEIFEGDLLGVLDTGAYGYSMSSNYNCRLRPAEVLITQDGHIKQIRRRDSFGDLLRPYIEI